jgi:hypothetical protein
MLFQFLISNNQSSQSRHREVSAFLLDEPNFLFIVDEFLHHHIGPFEIEYTLACLGIFYNNSHTFGLATEGKDVKDTIFD